MTGSGIGGWRGELALVFVAFVWGATFVLVKAALADVSTVLFLFLRFSLAGFVLAVAYHRRLSGTFSEAGFRLNGGILAGCCLFGGYLFQTLGLRLTTPSKSAFLTGMAIVLVPLLHSALNRKAPQISESVGVAVAVTGLGLMTLNGNELSVNPGDLLTLAGALFFALHILVVSHYSRRGFEWLSVVQIGVAALLAASTCWWVEPVYIRWSTAVLGALAVTGLVATAAAFTIQAWAQQHTSPTRTALIFALEPVFAFLTSFVVTGELLSGGAAVGSVLILAGILAVELKPFGRQEHPTW